MGSAANSGDGEVTVLLRAWRDGDDGALAAVSALMYVELRRQARAYMRRERPGHALQTTALVHEAFLRLANIRAVEWQDRTHFLAVAAKTMRRVLIDVARSQRYQKRGAGAVQVPLLSDAAIADGRSIDLIALDRALDALATHDPRRAQVVEMRFFGGLTTEEIAQVLGVSTDTVSRDWRFARTWLLKALNDGDAS